MKPEREGVILGLMTDEEKSELGSSAELERWSSTFKDWVDHDRSEPLKDVIAYRPKRKPLPKLTLEWIEANGGWPEWARYAWISDMGWVTISRYPPSECWERQCKVIERHGLDKTDHTIIERPKSRRPWGREEFVKWLGKPLKHDDFVGIVCHVSKHMVAVGCFRYTFAEACRYITKLDGTPLEVEE